MKLRIECWGNLFGECKVFDVDTGKELLCDKATVVLDPAKGVPVVHLVLWDFELEADRVETSIKIKTSERWRERGNNE